MIQKMMDELQSRYQCKSKDAGVFAKVIIQGAKFNINAYDVQGVGRIATVEMKRFIGGLEMQSMIITPYEKDMPIYYYNRHREKGNYIYRVEVFDTQFEQVDISSMAQVLENFATLPDEPQKERWYDEVKLPVSAVKKVNVKEKETLSAMIWEHFYAYLNLLDKAKECKIDEKKKKVDVFVRALCENSGIAIIEIFIAYYGQKITQKLAYEVLFGLK